MAQPQFPSIQGLAQMEFLPAFAFQQARDQTALANQFAQQEMQAGEQDIQAKRLANMFSEQNNPLRLEEARLTNTGKGLSNVMEGMKNEDYQAVRTEKVAASKAEALQKATQAELLQLQQRAQQEMAKAAQSGDKAAMDKAMKVMDGSWEEITRRRNAEDKRTLQREHDAAAMARTMAVQNNQNSREDKRLAARSAAGTKSATTLSDVMGLLRTGKLGTPDKALNALAGVLMDPDTPDADRQMAMQLRAQVYEEAMKRATATNAGKIDGAQLGGMPTIPMPTPSVTPPQAGGQPAQQAPTAPAKLKAPPTQADLEATARKYGVTVDEVKRRLGL